MFRRIENHPKFLADVDAYIRDHEQVSLEELVQAMQELGHDCTPRMLRPLLKESGLKAKSVNGRWYWGSWDEDDDDDDDEEDEEEDDGEDVDEEEDEEDEEEDVDEDDDDDDEDEERPAPEPLKRAEKENERLQAENNQLIAALLKTTQLKKSIQAMQEKLLLELADLIRATYGGHDSD